MEGFKSFKKVQCFKEGGSVKYETRKEHKEEMSADIAQDKKIVKKAFKIHDEQSHEGEKTNLSKLKKGGRAKKEVGSVKKYQCGGSVKKMQAGGSSGVLDTLRNNVMGTPEQNAIAKQKEAAYLKAKMAQKAAGASMGPGEQMAMGLAGMGQQLQPAAAPVGRKKGGKACK